MFFDDCACGMQYRQWAFAVTGVQMILGTSLAITGMATSNISCNWSHYDESIKCLSENLVSGCAGIDGCLCFVSALTLICGVDESPNWLMVYIALAGCSIIISVVGAGFVMAFHMQTIFAVLFFAITLWLLLTVVFVSIYRTIMIARSPTT